MERTEAANGATQFQRIYRNPNYQAIFAVTTFALVAAAGLAIRHALSAPLTHQVFTCPDPAPAAVSRAVMGGEMSIPRPNLGEIFERDYGEAWNSLSAKQQEVFVKALQSGEAQPFDPRTFPLFSNQLPPSPYWDRGNWQGHCELGKAIQEEYDWTKVVELESLVPFQPSSLPANERFGWIDQLDPSNPIYKYVAAVDPSLPIGTGVATEKLAEARETVSKLLEKTNHRFIDKAITRFYTRLQLREMMRHAAVLHKIQ